MKKIITLLLVMCLIFSLVGCSSKEEVNEISENSIIPKLSFSIENDHYQDVANAMNYLGKEVSTDLGIPAYYMTNNDILLTNDLDGTSNLIEELRYTANETQRILKYRYLCINNFENFDKEYVKKQIKYIFDIDLNEYDFDDAVDVLIEMTTTLEKDKVFPTQFETGNGIDIVVGIANTNNGIFLSVVGTYQYQEEIQYH